MTTMTNGWTNGSSSAVYQYAVTTGTTAYPYVVTAGGWSQPVPSSPPAPKPQTALEWLDAEIERTCALARLKPEAA